MNACFVETFAAPGRLAKSNLSNVYANNSEGTTGSW